MIFEYKDYSINYVLDGEVESGKNIIVILNGIMMNTMSWDIFKDAFTKDNVLLRFDMIDQGITSKVDFQYTQELQVEVLKALLEHLQIQKASLVGVSYGASVGLQFTCKHPNMVDKLVIANGVSKTSPWLKAIGDGWNEVAKSRNGEAYYNITIPYIYSPIFYTNMVSWMEDRKKILIPIFSDPTFLDAMIRLTISAETHDCVDQLPSIETDTLIISSEHDFLTPVYEQQFLHKNIKGSKLVELPLCGHASMYEKPIEFTQLVLEFINK